MTQQRGRVFKSADIVEQIKRMMWSPYIGVMLVQAGVPYVYKRTNMPDFATLRVRLKRTGDAVGHCRADRQGWKSGGCFFGGGGSEGAGRVHTHTGCCSALKGSNRAAGGGALLLRCVESNWG